MITRKLILAVASVIPMTASAVDYTWTGAASDGDWNNELNWTDIVADDGVPVDDNPGNPQLTLNVADQIIFSGTNLPTNPPSIGGINADANSGVRCSPAMTFNGGGAITFTMQSLSNGFVTNIDNFSRQILTVGDGAGGGMEDVSVTINSIDGMNRHATGDLLYQVNSDGTLIINGVLSRWGYSVGRTNFFKIAGGAVIFGADIGSASNFNDGAIEFLSVGGSVTSQYGGTYTDIASVTADLGVKFVNSAVDTLFEVTEDLVSDPNTFTVSVVQAPDPNFWTGTGGATWDQNTTVNFSTNVKAAPLVEDNFANATAVSGRATFADEYFNSGNPVAASNGSMTIAAGGVSTDSVDFSADSVAYSVASSDANGIAGTTNINLTGTAAVTLTGDHATTGNTSIAASSTLNLGDGTTDGSLAGAIGNSGTLNINNGAAQSRDAAIFGGGTINKSGVGTLTITASSTTSGSANVTEGTVLFQGDVDNEVTPFGGDIDIAAGATYEIAANDSNGGNLEMLTNTFTGGGTLRISGSQLVRWGGAALTMSLDSGALIDIQGPGRVRGGSNANDFWTGNLADLNIGFGGNFTTDEAAVRIDALTGDGLLGNGSTHPNYMPLTLGVDNGTGVFDGNIEGAEGSLTKEGTGTQTLNGNNTFGTNGGAVVVNGGELILNGPNAYTGDTAVADGTLTLGEFGTITFAPTAPGTTNKVAGITDNTTGNVDLDGVIFIDLNNTAQGAGNTWTLVDPTNLASVDYDQSLFYVDSTLGAFDFPDSVPGVWSLQDGAALWEFDENTGALSYSIGAGARLWVGNNGGGLWDQMTTFNWMDNSPSDPLIETDYMTAESSSGTVGFADSYFDSGVAVPVGTSAVTIAAGGISGETVDFLNIGTPYTITSSDAFGIAGMTNVNVSGGGAVIFQGDHASSGTTTLNSALTFDTSLGDASYASAITGTGGLEKTGAGVQILLGSTDFSGATTVTEGELVFTTTHASSVNVIASGATLTYDFDASFRIPVKGTYSGAGTLKKTGSGLSNFDDATFALGSGALVDVQQGKLVGGSSRNEDWSANLSDLNIAEGAIFDTSEANVFINRVTGDGILGTGFNLGGSPSYAQLTIGIDNGTATFGGDVMDHGVIDENPTNHFGHIHKVGTGTQTFNGELTIHGDYDVQEGTVTLGNTGSITFYPADNDETNQVLASVDTGTPILNIDGAINFDFSAANTTPGNMWTVLNPTNFTEVNIGETATVTSSIYGAFTETVLDTTFELDAGGNLWTFDVASATLSVAEGTPAGYGSFQTTYFTAQQILDGDADEGVDFDLGGLENGIEFVVGGDPADGSDDAALAPTLDPVEGGFEFTFRRVVDSISDNPGAEYTSDLDIWTLAVNGVNNVSYTVTKNFYGEGIDKVVVFLPDSLAVDGKLFARLTVTPAP